MGQILKYHFSFLHLIILCYVTVEKKAGGLFKNTGHEHFVKPSAFSGKESS
jgi:hypothetical protein